TPPRIGKYLERFFTSSTVSLIPRPPLRFRAGNSGRGAPGRSPSVPVRPDSTFPRLSRSGGQICIPWAIHRATEHFREWSTSASVPPPGWERISEALPCTDARAVRTGGKRPPPPPPVRRTSPQPDRPFRPRPPNRG